MSTPTDDIKLLLARMIDLPGMVKVERATFGSWEMPDFHTILRHRNNTVAYVAIYRDSLGRERVVGFVVMELGKYIMRVLNLAATWPQARTKLIEKANERADKHGVSLSFVG